MLGKGSAWSWWSRVLGFQCGEQVLTALLSPHLSSHICRLSSAGSGSPQSSQGPGPAASGSGPRSLCPCVPHSTIWPLAAASPGFSHLEETNRITNLMSLSGSWIYSRKINICSLRDT